ncbi:unnamed protein product [Caenorhabditis angaria]|uniref:Uncharacterized protein n=1 Tax=Caenorhabditis angaria TaxID=860376 RepID=A0A9P1IWY1_9PELO|nr:unnamed protein product [Caenorhabditis angaria]
MSDWTYEYAIGLLKILVHKENVEISEYGSEMFANSKLEDGELKEFLKVLFKKTPKLRKIYESVDELIEDLENIDNIPEIYRFSLENSNKSTSVESVFGCSSITRYIDQNEKEFISKHDIYQLFFEELAKVSHTSLSKEILDAWHVAQLNSRVQAYELVSYDVWNDFKKSFKRNLKECKPPNTPLVIKEKDFRELRKYFLNAPEQFDDFMENYFDKWENDQSLYQLSYAKAWTTLEAIQKTLKEFSPILLSSHKLLPTSKYSLPIIRLFKCSSRSEFLYDFVFSKEFEKAMMVLTKNNMLRIGSYCLKNGIDEVVNWKNALRIMETFGVKQEDFHILIVDSHQTYNLFDTPIISSSGKHCKVFIGAMRDILFYIVVILEVFQRSNQENLPKIFNWINKMFQGIAFSTNAWNCIEMWKISEIQEKAKLELGKYCTKSSIYEFPMKSQYTEKEAIIHVENLLKPMNFDRRIFNQCFDILLKKKISKITMSDIYWLYYAYMESQVLQKCSDIHTIFHNQLRFRVKEYIFIDENDKNSKLAQEIGEKAKIEEKNEGKRAAEDLKPKNLEFSTMKRGFLNAKKVAGDEKSKAVELKKEGSLSEKVLPKNSSSEDQKTEFSTLKKGFLNEKPLEKSNDEKKKIEEIEMKTEKMRIEFENEKKKLEQDLQTKCEENRKMSETLKNSKSELKKCKGELKESEKKLMENIEKNEKKVNDLKDRNKKIRENWDLDKCQHKNEKMLKDEEIAKMAEKLEKFGEDLEMTNSKLKILDKNLATCENSKLDLENEKEQLQKHLENQRDKFDVEIRQKNEENQELTRKHTKLQQKLQEKSKKLEELRDWFEKSTKNVESNLRKEEKIRRYQKYLEIDYDDLFDEINSNLNKMRFKFPNSSEIRAAKREIEKFDDEYEDYITNIRRKIKQIRENREENEEEEIQELPSKEFMSNYRKLLRDFL